MKKILICAFVLICMVSCQWFEAELTKTEKSIELTANGKGNYVYTGTLEEDIIYDELTLTVPAGVSAKTLTLGPNCLGAYAKHAKKVIVAENILNVPYGAFAGDTVLEVLSFGNINTVLAEGCCAGCTSLKEIYCGSVKAAPTTFNACISDD